MSTETASDDDHEVFLWERQGHIDVCRACGFVREGTFAATMKHHGRCAAARAYGSMLALLSGIARAVRAAGGA